MFSRTLTALAAATLLLSAAPVSAAAPASATSASAAAAPAASASAAADPSRWSVAPASASGPDGRISLRHTIEPGAGVSDAIAVTNLGTEPMTYAIAAGDGVLGDNGAFDVAAGDPRDSGAWISIEGVDAGTVTVAPGETRVLPVRIDVPADVTPGDHPAGIVVGVTRAADGVSVTNRVGVRVHLRVAGDIVPALQVSGVTASFTPSWIPFAPGTLRVQTDVVNTGNVRLGALGAVSGGGITSGALGGEPAEMLPGDTATVITETSAWPILALFGTSSVRPVALGDDAVPAPAVIDTGFVSAAPSWTGLALLVVVAALVAAVILSRRRRRGAADVAGAGSAGGADAAGAGSAGDAAGAGRSAHTPDAGPAVDASVEAPRVEAGAR